MTKGKFRKETSAAQQKRRTILQTYLTSLVSLVLCVTMFFGTTAAWFTDTVETNQNQMMVGTLKVQLDHASYKEGKLGDYEDVTQNNHKVFTTDTKWEPGYTAVEKFRLTELGSLAFGYKLNITLGDATVLEQATYKAFTEAISVWNYSGTDASGYQLPADFDAIAAPDSGWNKVGTLYDVLSNQLTVFSGSMDYKKVQEEKAAVEHIIALHMDEECDGVVGTNETIQGLTLDKIKITLVATQMSSENDAFGNDYDDTAARPVTKVNNTEELLNALATVKGPATIEMAEGTYSISENEKLLLTTNDITLKGAGVDKTVIDAGTTFVSGQAGLFVSANNVVIRDLTVNTSSADGNVAAIKVSDYNDAKNHVKNVRLENLKVVGSKGHGINLHGVEGAVINNVEVAAYSKCAIALAEATGVVISNTKTAAGGWGADVGCMYSSAEGVAYDSPCSVTIADSNTFGNGSVYSERPSTATGGADVIKVPESWSTGWTDDGKKWVAIAPKEATVSTESELKDALSDGATIITISGKITLTEGLNASNVTLVGATNDAAIDFAGHNITGTGTITYEKLKLSTISLPQEGNGERYGWYGGIDYKGYSVANYTDCEISGVFTLYSNTVNVTHCTFNPYVQDGEEFYHIFVYGSQTVNVSGSTFYYGDRSIKIYNEGGTKDIAFTIENSTFKAAEGAKVNKALINVDSSYLTSVTLNINSITVDTALTGVAIHNCENNNKVSVNTKP